MSSRALSIAAQVCAAALLASLAEAATLHVPSEYLTIQAGISAAVHGDEVLVAPGTYSGPGNQNINFLGKNITLRAEAGPMVTVIHPTGPVPRRGVILQSGETDVVIEGFTIQGGYVSIGSGGAIFCSGASVSISNCRIIQNVADGYGGGISCEFGSLEVIDSVIARNLSFDHGGFGGGVFAKASTLVLRGCTIFDNECDWGVQIDLFDSAVATVENTIVAFGYGSIGCLSGSTATILCSDIFANGSDWTGCIIAQQHQNGNMSSDPLFCDADKVDLRLSPGSPCLPQESLGCGLIGALGLGCGAVSAPEYEARSWGQIKGLYK